MPYVSDTGVKLENRFRDPELRVLGLTAAPASARYVLFSDLHRGRMDGADDFTRCRDNYRAALEHYLANGYTLLLLGDVEDLWEVPEPRWSRIFEVHAASYRLEQQFHAAGRYHRIFGNHDMPWASERHVRRLLEPLFPGIEVHEAIEIEIVEGETSHGTLFLMHGHQGELFSDALRGLARLFVRELWASIQNLTRIRSTKFHETLELENQRDESIYYDWAVTRNRTIVVSGHTHRTVFEALDDGSHPERVHRHIEKLKRRLVLAERSPTLGPDMLRSLRLWSDRYDRALAGSGSPHRFQPAFLNTGCCCYDNGAITGIEIADGALRSVQWKERDGTATRRERRTMLLVDALAATARSQPAGFWRKDRLNVVVAD